VNRARLVQSLALLGAVAAVVGPALKRIEYLPADEPSRRPSGPPNRSREEARRRRQMAARGLRVVEPAPVDLAACVCTEEGGGA
jgi:hypothetical protein